MKEEWKRDGGVEGGRGGLFCPHVNYMKVLLMGEEGEKLG